MCIILFHWQPDADTTLSVAANRDEFHHRPAEAARWRGDLLCGLDLEAGGTWFAVTRDGRWSAVTNFRGGGQKGGTRLWGVPEAD